MIHLPPLIEDLTLILMAAGIVAVLFKKFNQPVVLGYIVAGFLVGPHFPFFPTIGDAANVRVWGDIGILFLLFALGLEFSFKKLAPMAKASFLTFFIKIFIMGLIGFCTGQILGWNFINSLFLGAILSISSTAIIVRMFHELKMTGDLVALITGILIVEDLFAVLLLAALPMLGMNPNFTQPALFSFVLKLLIFFLFFILPAFFLLPRILKKLQPHTTEETLLIGSLGLCFLMVFLATQAGVPPALGAFLMGSILADTTERKRIERITTSVKDLFAAIFFVTVGMLIQPSMLWEYAGPIMIISAITIIAKVTSTFVGFRLSGRPPREALQAGFSLAQIGEFSFIIAALGESLKVTSSFLYPIAVGVSVLTTFITPYLMKNSDRIYERMFTRKK